MTPAALLVVLIGLSLVAYVLGKRRSLAVVGGSRGIRDLHSLPSYYGALTALWCAIPALLVLALWVGFQDSIITKLVTSHMPADVQALSRSELGLRLNDVRNVVAGNVAMDSARPEIRAAAEEYLQLRQISRFALTALVIIIGMLGMMIVRAKISAPFRARNAVERLIELGLIASSLIAVLTTVGIIASVAFEAARFFGKVPWYEFLFGLQWSPQTAIRADQVGSSGAFGAVPLFWGTIMISGIAMLIAVPVGLFSAIYLAEYAHRRFRAWTKPFLEVLAGVPTVVYGFFAALTVGPALRSWGEAIGLTVASESALAAGLVMGIMIVPFVSSLADDMITAVPQSLRDGAYALGATKSETIKQVVVRAALPGIV
ncbi:MAG TPA: PstC family ABC transporter permease, partial [Steroidobacteraceae bacterium]|nr:PstC family ABC transporter permease [Steroidobacteraceae bacterium]